MEVDPTVVLGLLDDSLVDRGNTGSNVVPVDKEMPKSRVNYIRRSGLNEKRASSISKRLLCDVDAYVAGERPSKSVAFHFDNEGGSLSSARCELVGVSDAGQLFPSSFRPDDTDYGTSELDAIAWS